MDVLAWWADGLSPFEFGCLAGAVAAWAAATLYRDAAAVAREVRTWLI